EAPAHAQAELGVRRQGGPAAAVAARPQGNPGRSPDSIRRPDPAAPWMGIPPPIVERRPAPGLAGLPIPPGIAVNPVAPIAVGAPTGRSHNRARLPAPTKTFQ